MTWVWWSGKVEGVFLSRQLYYLYYLYFHIIRKTLVCLNYFPLLNFVKCFPLLNFVKFPLQQTQPLNLPLKLHIHLSCSSPIILNLSPQSCNLKLPITHTLSDTLMTIPTPFYILPQTTHSSSKL